MNQVDQPQMAASALPFEFTGTGGEFFKIWIMNLILTILTLGVYSAWAKVRTNRYFYGNTKLSNSSFDYHADPIVLLKGRLISVALLLIYIFLGNLFPVAGLVFAVLLSLVVPWVIWRSIQFNARMTSYRNVRFSFDGKLGSLYKYILLLPFIPLIVAVIIGAVVGYQSYSSGSSYFGTAGFVIITIGLFAMYLMVPYIQKAITAYYINGHNYGQGDLSAELSGRKYYLVYLSLIGWSILIMIGLSIAIGVVAVLAGVDTSPMLQGLASAGVGGAPDISALPTLGTLAALSLPFLFVGIWFKAYTTAKIRSHVFANTKMDDVIQLESNMGVMRLFVFYLVNFLLMVATLGLAYPWVKVRIARFSADATLAHVTGNLDHYISQQQNYQSALGDEMGEAFDVGADVGLSF
ncbi:MAG: DUF898 domain-containing protein [Gammaproteobacteria bacterium]|nr:DUF898 domain-containing protein [Gammaproteobacteria bacterium]